MQKSKRTLPRHTVLAGQSRRIGAFLFDSLLFFSTIILLFSFVFSFVFDVALDPIRESYLTEQVNTGLVERKGKKGSKITRETSDEEIMQKLQYFYLNYLNNENIEEGKEGSKITRDTPYTIKMFNEDILQIGENPDSSEDSGYFTYVKSGSEYDKNQIGIKKDGIDKNKIHGFLEDAYVDALNKFNAQDYILKIVNKRNFLLLSQLVCSIVISAGIFYVCVPLVFDDGITFGKKLFGLGLVNKDGYKVEKWRIVLRITPLLIVVLSLLIPVWPDVLIQGLTYLTIFLTSFALMMASPNKSSLHDYAAGTLVIDYKKSLIFKTINDEEDYIFKEDGITEEEDLCL